MSKPESKESSQSNIRYRNITMVAMALLFLIPSLWAQGGHMQPEGPLDTLFLLKNSKTARISSYDRSGGNHD